VKTETAQVAFSEGKRNEQWLTTSPSFVQQKRRGKGREVADDTTTTPSICRDWEKGRWVAEYKTPSLSSNTTGERMENTQITPLQRRRWGRGCTSHNYLTQEGKWGGGCRPLVTSQIHSTLESYFRNYDDNK